MASPKKSGFVAVLGRPNSGKSTLLNWVLGERLALVSKKANATRKRMQIIVMHKNSQIVFVDTPGLHDKERELNKFMLSEALRALEDCDLTCFLVPVTDNLKDYENFLEHSKGRAHIVVLTKCDFVKSEDVIKKLQEYSKYSERFLDIVPLSATKDRGKEQLLDTIYKYLDEGEYYYDSDMMSNVYVKDIYKELIRETLFDKYSDEIPYGSDVVIESIDEGEGLDRVFAIVVVEKESQKGIVIGKGGEALKRLGKDARLKLEEFSGKKIYLKLFVKVVKNWTNNKKSIEDMGYR